jgi:type II secretion system (T2SS) protein M
MATLSRRERSLIGLAMGGLLVAAVYLYVVEPLVARNRELAELVPVREATLEARRRLVAQRPRLTQELASAQQGFEAQASRLLPGPTPPLAASQLQKLVKEVAASANVDVRSERVLAPADLAGVQEVPLELTIAGNVRETMTLLYQIERTNRLLTIKEVKVRVVAMGQPRDLLTTLIVAGYVLPPSGGGVH